MDIQKKEKDQFFKLKESEKHQERGDILNGS